jgi:hypothetical protein
VLHLSDASAEVQPFPATSAIFNAISQKMFEQIPEISALVGQNILLSGISPSTLYCTWPRATISVTLGAFLNRLLWCVQSENASGGLHVWEWSIGRCLSIVELSRHHSVVRWDDCSFTDRTCSPGPVPRYPLRSSLAFSCEGVTWSVMDVLGFEWRVIRSLSTPPVPGKYLKCLRSNFEAVRG